eukprot:Phypoly_transcript_12834.p1 GENE.Phypoly_transcript_12834~~Phypoly_transcript_12834.p1  ORF type:complete len:243 (+),score=52.32 Phypoly_transcript_12834:318-1046(+)
MQNRQCPVQSRILKNKAAPPPTYTLLQPPTPPAFYSKLPPNLPYASQQVMGITPHSLTVHHTHLKFLKKHEEREKEKDEKYSKRSCKENARAEKHLLKASQKLNEGKNKSAARHSKKAAKLIALSKIHHKTAQESRAEHKKAKALAALPPRPTLMVPQEGKDNSTNQKIPPGPPPSRRKLTTVVVSESKILPPPPGPRPANLVAQEKKKVASKVNPRAPHVRHKPQTMAPSHTQNLAGSGSQ